MLKEKFLFLPVPLEGIEALVATVTSTKLLKGTPVEGSDEDAIHYLSSLSAEMRLVRGSIKGLNPLTLSQKFKNLINTQSVSSDLTPA